MPCLKKNIFHILYNGILFNAIENEIMKLVELENFTLREVTQAQKGKLCVFSPLCTNLFVYLNENTCKNQETRKRPRRESDALRKDRQLNMVI